MSTLSDQKRALVTATLKALCKSNVADTLDNVEKGSYTAQTIANLIREKMNDQRTKNTIYMDSRSVGGILSLMYREKSVPGLERFTCNTLSETGNRLTVYSYRLSVD